VGSEFSKLQTAFGALRDGRARRDHATNLWGRFASRLDTAPAAGRTIVFAVSGYIPVVSDTNFNVTGKVTIAGQTSSWRPW